MYLQKEVLRIWIQHFKCIRIRIRIQGFDRKKYSWNKKFYLSLGLLIARPLYRTSKLQEKPSALKRQHPTIQKTISLTFFYIFVGQFCPYGSGSNLDPDPQQWQKVISKKIRKKLNFFYIMKVMSKKAESGVGSGCGIKRTDPDPYLNFTDPEHCFWVNEMPTF